MQKSFFDWQTSLLKMVCSIEVPCFLFAEVWDPESLQRFHIAMLCANWYHLYNLKNVKRYPWRSVPEASNFTKSNAPPWVFFTFFKLFELYQIAQCTISLVYYGVFEFVPLPTPILYYDFFTILVFRKFGAGERFQITSETKLFPLLVCFTLFLVQYYGQKN